MNTINEKYEKKIDELRQLSTNEGFYYIAIGNINNETTIDSNVPSENIIQILEQVIEDFRDQIKVGDVDYVHKEKK